MMNGLTYLLEANIYLAAAYGSYWVLLRKQTFYSANRAYLLLSIVVSFSMPLVQLELPPDRAESTLVPAQQMYFAASNANPAPTTADKFSVLTLNKALEAIFVTGATLVLVLFLLKLCSLLKLIFTHQHQKRSGYTLVCIPGLPSPFSFLDYLFTADEDDLTPAILQHELVHIGQKHSWDILFVELVKTISWFNPVAYLLQNSLKALHEYEADFESTGQGAHPDEYVQILIAKACQVSGLPLANHFSNKQLLKSRIMNLYQKRSGKLARLTYLITLPLCAGMLCASTMAFSKDYGLFKLNITSTGFRNDIAVETKSPVNKWAFWVAYKGKAKTVFAFRIQEPGGKIFSYLPSSFTASDKAFLEEEYGMEVTVINSINDFHLPMYGNVDTPKEIKQILASIKTSPPTPIQVTPITSSENKSTTIADDEQPDKKQRLKITSGSMTAVTEKLTVGIKDETLTFTADNLTAENKKRLAKLGVKVETTDAPATVKSLTLPPPPPPVAGNRAALSKYKTPHPVLPPPPPPSALPQKSPKTNRVKAPMMIYPDAVDQSQFSTPRQKSTKNNKMKAPMMIHRDTENQSLFNEMFKQVGRTTRYPTISKEKNVSGVVIATFRVNQDKTVSDVKIKKGVSPELDAEAARSISSFSGKLAVTPGIYSMGLDYVIAPADGSKIVNHDVGSEKLTAGIVTVVTY